MRDADSNLMSFGDHLEELRKRLWLALLGPLPVTVAALFFGSDLLVFLIKPLEAELKAADQPVRLLATGPAETFAAYLKVALVAGILIGFPWVLYQLWLFIAPGLYRHERRFVYFLLPLSAALTAVSATFLYTVLLPVMLRFFIIFGSSLAPPSAPDVVDMDQPMGGPIPVLRGDPASPAPGSMWVNETLSELRIAIGPATRSANGASGSGSPGARVRILGAPLAAGGMIAQQYRVSEYVNMLFTLGLVFALAFQLPVVMLLGGWIGVMRQEVLRKWRRYVLFGCAVVGAVLTPADPISMVFLAVPLYALFEIGLLLMRLAPASRVADGPDAERERPDAEA